MLLSTQNEKAIFSQQEELQMPTIKTYGTMARFFTGDIVRQDFTEKTVQFYMKYTDETGSYSNTLTITGQFEDEGGIISGSISAMKSVTYKFVPPDTGIYNTQRLTLLDSEFHIDDLAALVTSGTIGTQFFFSGDDDVTGYNKGHNGNDTLHAYAISKFDGGIGFDTLIFDQGASGVKLDLNRDGANFKSIEAFVGSKFGDDMRGTAGADNLNGGAGSDLLVGRTGNDVLNGGADNDKLIGSTGIDILTGGSGKDTFIFERVTDSTRSAADRITDFNRADDIIDLRLIDANTERSGNQAFTFIGTEAFHGVAGELRFGKSGDKTVITGDIDGDRVVDFGLYLDQYMKLTSLDFIL